MIDKLIAEKAARINDIVESYLPPADGFNRTCLLYTSPSPRDCS